MTVIGMMIVACCLIFFGLVWGMPLEMAVIISIFLAQNGLAIIVSWFASKHEYSNIRWYLLEYWATVSFIIAFLFLGAVLVESMWWWTGTSLAFILTEIILTLLGFYLANQKGK